MTQYMAGHDYKVLVVAETGTFPTVKPPAAGGYLPGAKATITPDQTMLERDGRRHNRARMAHIQGKRGCDVEIEMEIMGAGSATGSPDDDDLLQGIFEASNTTATTVDDLSPAADTFDVATPGNLAEGKFVTWTNAAGKVEVRMVTDITSSAVTVDPPFSAVPTNGDAIGACRNYKLVKRLTTVSFSVYEVATNMVKCAIGFVPSVVEISASGAEKCMIKLIGRAADFAMAGETTLAAAITTTGETDLTLTDSKKYTPNAIILVDDEQMLITAINYATDHVTVTRGYNSTSAATHLISAAVTPYVPTTLTSNDNQPLVGVSGGMYLYSSATAVDNKSFTVSVDEKVKLLNDHFGSYTAKAFDRFGVRDVRASIEAYLTDDNANLVIGYAKSQVTGSVLIQMGDTTGSIRAIYLPTLELDSGLAQELGADEEESMTIEGYGLLDSADTANSEFSMMSA